MMQKQINYLIVGIVALLLVILGVYYYKNKVPAEIPEQVVTEDTTPAPEPKPTSTTSSGEAKPTTQPVSSPSASEIKAKFNTAMTNASKAFLNKDYSQAILYYNQALTYKNADTAYSGLFTVYGAQGDWVNAEKAIDSAIKLNPLFTDHWKSKISLLDEKTPATYQDLKNVYNEGLLKVDPKTKIDLVTYFARIAESNAQIPDAISLWEYAKTLYPQNSVIYQGEIDRLQNKM